MTVRWGILGTGRIAEKFVVGLAGVPDAEVVAVASRTPGRAAGFAARHGIGRAHGSYGDLATDDGVDVVYVATTQEGHHDVVCGLLAEGRHVLCEKPLALREAQAVAMTDAAAAAGRFLMEAMWSRFSPAYRVLGGLLGSGRIGEVLQVRADLSLRIAPGERATHRLWDPGRGGGALLDVGIYPLQLASLVLGPPSGVTAAGRLTDRGVDRRVAVLLEHPDGSTAVLTAGIDLDGGRDARISGSAGSIGIEAPMHAPTELVLEVGGERERIPCGPPGLWRQVPEVHRCIAEGLLESPVMPWAESRSLLATADRVRAQIGLDWPDGEP